MTKRPDFIVNWRDHVGADENAYPGSEELLCYGAELTTVLGFTRLGLGVDILNAHESEEEFILILEGTPDLWVDGEVHRIGPGDCVGFPSGTGIAHTFMNNTDDDVIYLVVGERDKEKTRLHYPLHPARNAEIGERHWHEQLSKTVSRMR